MSERILYKQSESEKNRKKYFSGIDHVAINVRDLTQALEFYTGILGLVISEREYQKPGVEYFLDLGTSLVGLIQAGDGQEHLFQNEGVGANHFAFRVATSDFDAMVARLEQAEVKMHFVKKREFSWSAYFEDPDGNKLEMTAWPGEDNA